MKKAKKSKLDRAMFVLGATIAAILMFPFYPSTTIPAWKHAVKKRFD